MRRQAEGLLGHFRRYSIHFVQDAPRLHHSNPVFGIALALAHTGLGRLLGDRLVGEDANPDSAAAFDMARHGDPGRFELSVRDPARLERLQAVVAERHLTPAVGLPPHAPLVHLPMFNFLGSEHESLSYRRSSSPSALLCDAAGRISPL